MRLEQLTPIHRSVCLFIYLEFSFTPVAWPSGSVVACRTRSPGIDSQISRVYLLGVSVAFVHVLSYIVFLGGPCIMRTTDQGRPSNCIGIHLCDS